MIDWFQALVSSTGFKHWFQALGSSTGFRIVLTNVRPPVYQGS